jgi:hypothetical protein
VEQFARRTKLELKGNGFATLSLYLPLHMKLASKGIIDSLYH